MVEKSRAQMAHYVRYFNAVQGFLLYFKCNSVGSFPIIIGSFSVTNNGTLDIGKRMIVYARPLRSNIKVERGGKLIIGDNVRINNGVNIGCTHHIEIGDDVMIGDLVGIIDSNYHPCDIHDDASPEPVYIGDNVWIARQCTVLPGVTIGKNSVIAAGSIVTRDIPENVLVAGAPARVIRPLTVPEGWVRWAHPTFIDQV